MKQQSLLNIEPPESHAHSQVIVYFGECWKREKGGGVRSPLIQWKRDGAIIKGLLKQYPAEYIERLMRIFLTRAVFQQDKYCYEQGWDIPSFLRRANLCINIEANDKPRPFVTTHHIPTRSQKFESKEALRAHLESLAKEGT